MNAISVQQCLEEIQEEDVVCFLCEGQHGNNSNCQRND
jgi:hypothetical protein